MNFSELINALNLDCHSASLTVPADWLQGRSVYGGLQTAMAVAAMRTHVGPHLPLRSLQITFIGPVDPGEVRAESALLRSGRSASHVNATIQQHGQTVLHAIGIFGEARYSTTDFQPSRPEPVAAPEAFEDVPYFEGRMPAFLQHLHMRPVAGAHPFSGASKGGSQFYMRHRDDDAMSEGHLFALADATPPAAMPLLDKPGRVSSMNWNFELLITPDRLAEQRWFFIDTELDFGSSGYTWETARIYTLERELIAISRQCVGIFEKPVSD